MGRRSVHSPEELRQLILDASQTIVERNGITGLSAREIARMIGYSPGTLYNISRLETDGRLDHTPLNLNLGGTDMRNNVTLFTASDFGRTITTNGDGTDHGWGGHHFVLGGAVRGGRIYGQMPTLALSGPNDAGDGRWIPTTSVDEYSATLARWFGVAESDLALVLPNLGRFANPDRR
jgi:hypothetical protein